MAPRTLAHHRKSDNRYTFGFGRQTITLTRRFLPNRSVRVRVTSETVSGKGEGNWTDYRDFTDMHEGDAAYAKQAQRLCTQWEERYCSTTPKKKETSVSDEPTQEPTQKASADTDREPATPNRQGMDAILAKPPHVVDGEVVGRVLGEWSIKLPGRRMGRSDAMLMLLKAQTNHLRQAEMGTHALRSGVNSTPEAVEHVADLQVKATYFRALRDAGYAADTTWDELIDLLRPIVSTALHGLDDQRAALTRVNRRAQVSIQRSIDAAELFLNACAPVLSFFKDDEDEGSDED